MAHEVRGVIARGKGAEVEVTTVLVPDPGPGEALVKVQACGVCHTDLHYREGGIGSDFPYPLRRGRRVAVLGGGAGGAASVLRARLPAGRPMVAVDVDDRKLEWPRQF